MITSISGFIWNNVPIMYAIFTIIFLVIIRMWTRDGQTDRFGTDRSGNISASDKNKTADIIKNIGKKIGKAGKEISVNAKDITEGFEFAEGFNVNAKKIEERTEEVTSSLDNLFFGELFIAGICAGLVMKFGWLESPTPVKTTTM